MSRLPFVTKPEVELRRIGNKQWGILEFPVYGDTLIGEQIVISRTEREADTFHLIAKHANEIAKAEECSALTAYLILQKALLNNVELTQEEETIRVKHYELFHKAGEEILEASWLRICNNVTAIIQHRLPGMDDWDRAQTEGLPAGLVTEIWEFMNEEGRKTQLTEEEKAEESKTQEEQERELEEDIKKLEAVNSNVKKNLIGETSTGGSNGSGPEGKNSTAKTSPNKLSPTSKPQRSKGKNSTQKISTSKNSQ